MRIIREIFWFWHVGWTYAILFIAAIWLIYGLSLPEFRAWFGWPTWWLRIVAKPEALATVIAGGGIALAAAIGLGGVYWRATREERNRLKDEIQERDIAVEMLAAEMRHAAYISENYGRELAGKNDKQLEYWDIAGGRLQQLTTYPNIIEKYNVGLVGLPAEVLDMIFKAHRYRESLSAESEQIARTQDGERRSKLFQRHYRRLLFSSHRMNELSDRLTEYRGGAHSFVFRSVRAINAAVEDDIQVARLEGELEFPGGGP